MDPQATIRSSRSSRRTSLDAAQRKTPSQPGSTRVKTVFDDDDDVPYGRLRRPSQQQMGGALVEYIDDWRGNRDPSPSSSSASFSSSSPANSPRMSGTRGAMGHRRSRPRLADVAQLRPSLAPPSKALPSQHLLLQQQQQQHQQQQQLQLQQQQNQQQRWSVWTADTTAHSSDCSFNDDDGLKAMPPPYHQHHRHGHGHGHGAGHSHGHGDVLGHGDEDEEEEEEEEEEDRPPSPGTEAALDAALSTTMLALTTANSLLLSTMASRADLARLRAAQSSLEVQLQAREAELHRDVELHQTKLRWIEAANKRLEAVLQQSSSSPPLPRPSLLHTQSAQQQHWRRPSLGQGQGQTQTQTQTLPTAALSSDASTRGIVEAKDDSATIGKSAAKRLERMLRQSSSQAHAPVHSRDASAASAVIHEEAEGEGDAEEEQPLPSRPPSKRPQLASPAVSLAVTASTSPAVSLAVTAPTTATSSSGGIRSGISSDDGSSNVNSNLNSNSSSAVSSRPPSTGAELGSASRASGALSALLGGHGGTASAAVTAAGAATTATAASIVTTPPTPAKSLASEDATAAALEQQQHRPASALRQRWSQSSFASTGANSSSSAAERDHPSPGLAYCHRRPRGASGSYLASDAAALGLFTSHDDDDDDDDETTARRRRDEAGTHVDASTGERRRGALGALKRLNEQDRQDKLDAAAPASFLQSPLSKLNAALLSSASATAAPSPAAPSMAAAVNAPSTAAAAATITTGPTSPPMPATESQNQGQNPGNGDGSRGWGGTLASWVRLSSNSNAPLEGLPAQS